MTVTIPWAYVEAGLAITACIAVGALVGAFLAALRHA